MYNPAPFRRRPLPMYIMIIAVAADAMKTIIAVIDQILYPRLSTQGVIA